MITYVRFCCLRQAVFRTIILFSLTAFSTTSAQTIPILNPSLEGPKGGGLVPAPWYILEATPDTEPLGYLVPPASHGATFIGLWWSKNGGSEAMAYPLDQQLDSGRTYKLSFDLAMGSGQPPVFRIGYGTLVIQGSNNRYEAGDTLWKSGLIPDKAWKRHTAILKPLKNYRYLSFRPYKADSDSSIFVVTYIDNFSDITETITWDITTKDACPGQSNGEVAINIPGSDGTYTYRWEPGSYTTSSVTGLPAGKYFVQVTNSRGLTISEEAEIKTTSFSMATNVKGLDCYGDKDFYLDIAASGGQPPYRYFLNDDIAGQDAPVFRNITTGNHKIKVKDAQGCSITVNVPVKEPDPLVLNNISVKATSCGSSRNGEIILTPAGGTPPYTYRLPAQNRAQPENTFRRLNEGTYHYTISDKNNCTIAGDAEIKQQWDECSVIIPNAFSPNGDGLNELFRPRVRDNLSEYRMAVYGRWGQLIFESNSPEQGWDGKLQGTAVPAGNYTWVITYKNSSNQYMRQQGAVLLVR